MGQKVLLGMSGGIDSSVAAILLQQQGYTVIGATLRLWSESDDFENETMPQYIQEAKELADKLGFNHIVYDARKEFYKQVILYFKEEYLAGRTPNPCAKCNVVLKWRLLNELAIKYSCAFIASGHYVDKIGVDNLYYIRKGIDPDKEQSFFLWGLGQQILKKALFPLGQLTKAQVKEIAMEKGFSKLEQKKESTGVCFIQNQKYHPLLSKLLASDGVLIKPGNFIDHQGEYLGKHMGYPFYTVGQRRGLGLSPNEPWFVTKIEPNTNQITLGKRADLYQTQMWVRDYKLINPVDFLENVEVRIRYRKQQAFGKVTLIDDKLLNVSFEQQEWSIAPGQTVAFYKHDRLLGGGFIVD
jgi:tRNA-specific 2-thiouridylase